MTEKATLSPETIEALKVQADILYGPLSAVKIEKSRFVDLLQAAAVVAVEGMQKELAGECIEQASADDILEKIFRGRQFVTKSDVIEQLRDLCSAVNMGRAYVSMQGKRNHKQFLESHNEITRLEAEIAALRRLPVYEKTTVEEAKAVWLAAANSSAKAGTTLGSIWDSYIERRFREAVTEAVAAQQETWQQELRETDERWGKRLDAMTTKNTSIEQAVAFRDAELWQTWLSTTADEKVAQAVAAERHRDDIRSNEQSERHAAEMAQLKFDLEKIHEEEMESISADAQSASDECGRLRAELAPMKADRFVLEERVQLIIAERDAFGKSIERLQAELAQERSNWQARMERVEAEHAEDRVTWSLWAQGQIRQAVAAAYVEAARVLDKDGRPQAAMIVRQLATEKIDAERAAKPQEEGPAVCEQCGCALMTGTCNRLYCPNQKCYNYSKSVGFASLEKRKRCIHGGKFPCPQCKANRNWNEAATGKKLTEREFEERYVEGLPVSQAAQEEEVPSCNHPPWGVCLKCCRSVTEAERPARLDIPKQHDIGY